MSSMKQFIKKFKVTIRENNTIHKDVIYSKDLEAYMEDKVVVDIKLINNLVELWVAGFDPVDEIESLGLLLIATQEGE